MFCVMIGMMLIKIMIHLKNFSKLQKKLRIILDIKGNLALEVLLGHQGEVYTTGNCVHMTIGV